MNAFDVFVIVLLSLLVVMLGFSYHKLSSLISLTRLEGRRNSNNIITQVEGLMALCAEVRPDRALPKSRGWAASPDVLGLVIRLTQEHKPTTVVECSSGFSTLILAACMRNQGRGKVISLEHDAVYAEKTRDLLVTHDLQDWATVLVAPLEPYSFDQWSGSWYSLAGLPAALEIDLLVVDGPPQKTGQLARYPALPLLATYLSEGSHIVLDDADRLGERASVDRWLKEVPDLELIEAGRFEKGCAVFRSGASTVQEKQAFARP